MDRIYEIIYKSGFHWSCKSKGEIQVDVPPKHILSAAAIVLDDQGEILLIQRSEKRLGNAGGQVEEGESLKEATIPKVKEETE